MNRISRILSLCLSLICISATAAQAEDVASTRWDYRQGRFQVYTGYGGSAFWIDNPYYDILDDKSSNYGSFHVGFGFGLYRDFSLFWEGMVGYFATVYNGREDHFAHGMGAFGLRYTPLQGPTYHTQPYFKGGLGNSGLAGRDSQSVRPVCVAIGVDHFVGRRAALYAESTLAWDKMNEDSEREARIISSFIHFGVRFRVL